LKAEIQEPSEVGQDWPQILLEMRDIAMETPPGQKAESLYKAMTVLSTDEVQALVANVTSSKSMTTVSAPHLVLLSGHRNVFGLSVGRLYVKDYVEKVGIWMPVIGEASLRSHADAEAVVAADAVVFKHLRYKNIDLEMRPCSATFSAGEDTESKPVTVNVTEPIATTCTAALEKPAVARLKSDQSIVLPPQVAAIRGFSNFRARWRDSEFRERPVIRGQLRAMKPEEPVVLNLRAQKAFLLSSRMVTGPALVSETSINA